MVVRFQRFHGVVRHYLEVVLTRKHLPCLVNPAVCCRISVSVATHCGLYVAMSSALPSCVLYDGRGGCYAECCMITLPGAAHCGMYGRVWYTLLPLCTLGR